MDHPKLNDSQIQALYQFTQAHYVEYFDVQTELVDHLANDIEAQWQSHPSRSFNEALQQAFKTFGVYGFAEVVAAKKKAMASRYRGLLWQQVKIWFKWPKLMSTLLALLLAFSLMQWLGQFSFKADFINGLMLVLMVLGTIHYLISKKASKQKAKFHGKNFLLAALIYNFKEIYNIAFLCIYPFFSFRKLLENVCYTTSFDLLFSLVLVGLLLIAYIALVVLPAKAKTILAETYPAYKMMA